MKRRTLNLLIGSLLIFVTASDAEVLYQQTFDNPLGDQPLGNVNWNANIGPSGTTYLSANGGAAPILSSGDFLYTDVAGEWLAWTDDASFGSFSSITNISMSLANSTIDENNQIAIKVDGFWYVSQEVFNSAAADAKITVNLDVQAAAWNNLDFVPGATLVVGGAAGVLAGTVQAVGVYDFGSDNKTRMDNFTVGGVPSPPTVIVYEQTFDNPEGNQPLTNVNWNANVGSSGTTYTSTGGAVAPILSGSDFLYTDMVGEWLGWTADASFGSFNNLVNISMSLSNANLDEDLQVAIKVDGSWYVSQKVFNNSVSNVWQHGLSLEIQSAAWNNLAFVPNSTLAVGDAVTNALSGAVQAVGVYDFGSDNKTRMDDFTVEAIQEITPSEAWAAWTNSYSLSGSDAELGADPDFDDMDNLVEYALGGNPTNSDAAATLPVSGLVDAGSTNWLEYVYLRRLDAATRGLTYEVVRNDSLQVGSWTNSEITEVTAAIDADFEAVTNRISTATKNAQFMRLNIEFE